MARSRLIIPPIAFESSTLPFSFIASRLVKEDKFRADMLAIEGMADEQFRELSSSLASFPSFLDKAAVENIVGKCVEAARVAEIAELVYRLNDVLRGSSDAPDDAVRLLVQELSAHGNEFPEPVLTRLSQRLTALVVVPRGFTLQQKAELLAEATGAELVNLNIICDVRPVFDNERTKIEGVIAVTTLRLELNQPDGTVLPVECRLTEPQLERLGKAVDRAQNKLSVIKGLLEQKEVPLAKTDKMAPLEDKS